MHHCTVPTISVVLISILLYWAAYRSTFSCCSFCSQYHYLVCTTVVPIPHSLLILWSHFAAYTCHLNAVKPTISTIITPADKKTAEKSKHLYLNPLNVNYHMGDKLRYLLLSRDFLCLKIPSRIYANWPREKNEGKGNHVCVINLMMSQLIKPHCAKFHYACAGIRTTDLGVTNPI